nr:IPT/TIG domain-containing protein [uncultured Bacteroides sp.]
MKYSLIKNTLGLLALISFPVLFAGCEQDAKFKTYVYPTAEISEMYPKLGYAAEKVTFTGTNFGDRKEALKIAFGGVAVSNILSCNNNCVVVEVPEGAVAGEVTLQTWNNEPITVGTFKVYPTPMVEEIFSHNTEYGSNMAVEGDLVTIKGANFGTDKSLVEVKFNGTVAPIESLVDEQIVVRTPAYTSGLVTVTIRPETNANSIVLTGTGLMDPQATGDVTSIFLQNSVAPFSPSGAVGTWAIATGWHTSGGFDGATTLQFTEENPDGLFVLECWGSNKKENAKIYQVATLPKGDYVFELDFVQIAKEAGRFGVHFVIAEGDGTIPNLVANGDIFDAADENVGKVIGSYAITGSMDPHTKEIAVHLDETKQLTMGFVTQLNNKGTVKLSAIRINREMATGN